MESYRYILAFDTTSHSIRSEHLAAAWPLHFSVVPLPTEIAADCGLALNFTNEALLDVLAFYESLTFPCRLYRQSTEKINGIRETMRLDPAMIYSDRKEMI